MPRVKVPRKSTSVDMTAMCDVAFLLLTFFILTATSRQPDPLDIKTPSSTVQFKVPDKDLAILSIGKGKVFVELIGQDIKRETLLKMGALYGAKFTEAELKRFAVMSSFGVPMQGMKQFINMSPEERTKSKFETGIPVDSTANNELYRWIEQSRYAVAELHKTEMRVSIKGDGPEEYPVIRKIVEVLQKQKVNKFSLITSAEAAAK
ncbi:biopolymer transporter ExbD [Pedobacter frigiditerrae]|uniref:Biopolymer transporter ExbD n=1 Tax=Pedobacter frigiditerrae TaxID=2530452 RepID=A0A4R0N2W7_9SPHI|nr:biopolymer transporter ExbD [Pedobacter frigiditerrae]TCC94065.1 biopolymer transporter ExbD [Pedobacter frigiditerrae]